MMGILEIFLEEPLLDRRQRQGTGLSGPLGLLLTHLSDTWGQRSYGLVLEQ